MDGNILDLVWIGGTSGFIYSIVLFISDNVLLSKYNDDNRVRRITFAILEGFCSLITIIMGIVMLILEKSQISKQGVWQTIMFPSFLVGIAFILAYRKSFSPKIMQFILIHHAITKVLLIVSVVLGITGIIDPASYAPYILIWNGSTLIWVVNFSWYTRLLILNGEVPIRHQLYMKVWSLITQRLWRTAAWVCMIIFCMDEWMGVVMYSAMALCLEIYDTQDQIKSVIKLYQMTKEKRERTETSDYGTLESNKA